MDIIVLILVLSFVLACGIVACLLDLSTVAAVVLSYLNDRQLRKP